VKKIFLIATILTLGISKWQMFSSNDGTFIYETEKGVTFRYFDTGTTMGFGKLNFRKNAIRSTLSNRTVRTKEPNDLATTSSGGEFSKNQIEQLKNIMLNNKSKMMKDVLK
jgi:hypothetical protein